MAAKLWILIVLSLSAGISAQDYCFSDDWLLDMGLCFLQKYTDLIGGLIPATSQSRHDTRRSLQSLALFDPQVNIVGNSKGIQSTLERLTSKAKRMQESYLSDDIMDAVLQKIRKSVPPNARTFSQRLTPEQRSRMKILEKLAKIDTTKVLTKLTEEAVTLAYQLHTGLEHLMSPEQMTTILEIAKNNPNITYSFENFKNMNQYTDITDLFGQLATTMEQLDELLGVVCALCPFLCPSPWDDIICGAQAVVEEIGRLFRCFSDNYTETDFEDGIEWLQCVYECGDIPAMGECVRSVSADCDSPLVGDLILEVAAEYIFGLGQCRLEMDETPIVIEEGGDPYDFSVMSYMPHTLYCLDMSQLNTPVGMIALLVVWIQGGLGDCPVEIEVSTQNYLYPILSMDVSLSLGEFNLTLQNGWPRCRDGGLVNQALIARHTYDAGDCSCSVSLDADTWNQTHTFPISAAIDNKIDGDITAQLTVKLKVKGFVVDSKKIEMTITDQDRNAVCASMGDPHVRTFDGVILDNYYEGYFQLYEHQNLPYEVQVIQQNCSSSIEASCTCAVAVRTGDDVFKVDRCRVEGSDDVPPTIAVMYLNGELNPGTRIFSKEDGNRFDIVLPIGTIVTMTIGAENSINVWIMGSAHDQTPPDNNNFPPHPDSVVLGLCGNNDADPDRDLLNPDEDEVPVEEFIESWRIDEVDRIFYGAEADDSLTTASEMCRCTYMIMFGVQCQCGYDQYVDLCDFDTDGEMTSMIEMISRQSDKQRWMEGLQSNWPYEQISVINNGSTVVVGDWPNRNVTWQNTTEELCADAVLNDAAVAECITGVEGFDETTVQYEIDACIADVRLSNGTDFVTAAVESAKLRCTMMISQETGMFTSYNSVANNDCLNNCNNNGLCDRGTCTCNTGYTGSDCSRLTDAVAVVTGPTLTMCDTRGGTCQYANILGYGFKPEKENVTYYVQQNELTSSDTTVKHPETRQSSYGRVISQNQIACQLPQSCLLGTDLCQGSQAFGGVYQIEIEGSDVHPEVIVYDSACYDCTTSPLACALKQTQDYCMISGTCYSNLTYNPDDSCYLCDPTRSTSQWNLDMGNQGCIDAYNEAIEAQNEEDREDKIRIIVACTLSGAVVLAAIILFFTVGRLKKPKHKVNEEGNTEPDEPEKQRDNAYDFVSETGITLVRSKPNGEVNAGFDFGNSTYANAEVAGTSDGTNGDAVLY